MSNDPRNLWGILDNYLPKLETANVSTTTRQALRREANRAQEAARTAREQLQTINADATLSPHGKHERGQQVMTTAQAEINAARERITQALQAERQQHETRVTWPRSTGTDADREARLSNARQDLHNLMANVKPGQRADRLAFALRNGNDAMRELVYGERYAERILWPSLEDSQADAVTWANARNNLMAEHHPGGEEARASLATLAALNTTGQQIETIITHATNADQEGMTAALGQTNT